MKTFLRAGLLVSAAAGLPGTVSAQDAERATHTDSASQPQLVFEDRGQDHVLQQYQLGCLSHLSYLVVSRGEAAVIDPQRDVAHYLAAAKDLGATIRWAILTHPHADFVAGHTELRERTGAEIAISGKAGAKFAHRALGDGAQLTIGAVTLTAWDTPGHTPNAMTFLLRVPGGKADPAFALTGDTLFIGGIGRPDLLDVPPAELAAASWDSVTRLKTLPDATLVLPAHGAGSLCGAHLSPATTSTIGDEKATNPYLRSTSKAGFVANMLSHQPVAPQYFRFNVAMNLDGPPAVAPTGELPAMASSEQVKSHLDGGGWVVDLREAHAYAGGHLLGAINVALRGRLDTWTGIVVPFGAPLLLVGSDDEVREGTFRLQRIGYDRTQLVGRVGGDAAHWREQGLPVRTTKLWSPAELHTAMRAGTEPMIVDVRSADEYADLRLGEVGNIPVTEPERFGKVFGRQDALLMVCNSAYRSSIAAGLAERAGFTDVGSLDGGMDAWVTAGLPTVGRMTTSTAPAADDGPIALPEPIDATLLQRVLAEQAGSYAVLDVRPAWQFADWRIPGSMNVTLDAVAARVDELPATIRIVLVDRDGTSAFAVAGALLQRNPRQSLRVLLGGVAGYWQATAFGGQASTAPSTMSSPPTPSAAPAVPQPAKKRSAGC